MPPSHSEKGLSTDIMAANDLPQAHGNRKRIGFRRPFVGCKTAVRRQRQREQKQMEEEKKEEEKQKAEEEWRQQREALLEKYHRMKWQLIEHESRSWVRDRLIRQRRSIYERYHVLEWPTIGGNSRRWADVGTEEEVKENPYALSIADRNYTICQERWWLSSTAEAAHEVYSLAESIDFWSDLTPVHTERFDPTPRHQNTRVIWQIFNILTAMGVTPLNLWGIKSVAVNIPKPIIQLICDYAVPLLTDQQQKREEYYSNLSELQDTLLSAEHQLYGKPVTWEEADEEERALSDEGEEEEKHDNTQTEEIYLTPVAFLNPEEVSLTLDCDDVVFTTAI